MEIERKSIREYSDYETSESSESSETSDFDDYDDNEKECSELLYVLKNKFREIEKELNQHKDMR